MNTETLLREQKLLFAHAPELRDAAMRQEFYAAMMKGGREYGFSRQEIDGVYDHRVMLMHRDALMHLGLWKPVWEAE